MDKYQALHNLWSSFGIPAYDVSTVPDDAQMPYLTYEAVADSFDNMVAITNSLYYYSKSWEAISQKSQQIADYIGMGGKLIAYDGGAVWVQRGTPFSQRMITDNDAVRRIVLNFTLEFLSEN